MKHLIAVAGMIEAAGLGVIGEDLYIGTIPADVRKGVMLRDPLTGATIDRGMMDFYSHDFQVIVRDPDVAAGYRRATDILKVLELTDWENSEVHISWLIPRTKPVSYPRGDAGDLETSFAVSIGYGEKS